ncbi:hypothetical protein CYLTODRAFT_415176 [Cylindrobasidium torrendii FP15055 ss-10]|uniref:Uncharacterized protein n=1 Tax=Cylindrobasidium torrendii FP15055 ss-10 TaxID=1314674 RepID=A0A0D7AUE3_9AGAR|nr:hypothetical protein CYLTODRAFT_415176 [Cylindrobasidium torrendii FP15055 ss-10]
MELEVGWTIPTECTRHSNNILWRLVIEIGDLGARNGRDLQMASTVIVDFRETWLPGANDVNDMLLPQLDRLRLSGTQQWSEIEGARSVRAQESGSAVMDHISGGLQCICMWAFHLVQIQIHMQAAGTRQTQSSCSSSHPTGAPGFLSTVFFPGTPSLGNFKLDHSSADTAGINKMRVPFVARDCWAEPSKPRVMPISWQTVACHCLGFNALLMLRPDRWYSSAYGAPFNLPLLVRMLGLTMSIPSRSARPPLQIHRFRAGVVDGDVFSADASVSVFGFVRIIKEDHLAPSIEWVEEKTGCPSMNTRQVALSEIAFSRSIDKQPRSIVRDHPSQSHDILFQWGRGRWTRSRRRERDHWTTVTSIY